MNLLVIIVFLFSFTLNVKVSYANNATKTDEKTTSIQDTEYTNTLTQTSKVTTSFSTGTSSTMLDGLNNISGSSNTTETGEIQNKTSCENGTVSSKGGVNNVCGGNQFIFLNLDMRTILIFLLGVICSALIFSTVLCCVAICNRCRAAGANKDKESIVLEAVNQENDLLVMQSDGGQVDEQDPLQVQTPAEMSVNSGTGEERKILGKEQTEGAGEVTEVDYASINYSLLQKKDDGDLKPKQAESDYAEIQIKKLNEGEEVQTLQDGVKKDEVAQDGAKQDGMEQGLESGMESEKQGELEEVQV